MNSFTRSSFIPKNNAIYPKCIKDPLVLGLKSINNNMRRMDAYVVLGLKGKRKLKEEEERRNKQSNRRKKESSLERQRKANPILFLKDSLPRTGFLDAIRNFILYTVMGKMVPFVLKNLPAILNASKLLIPVYNFFENFLGNVLKGVVNAIDFGYSIHDKMRKLLKDVTGSKFEKTFDDLEKNLNNFLNLAIIAGLAIGGAGIGNIAKGRKTGLNSLTVQQLKKLAKEKGLKGYSKFRKAELVDLLENKPKPVAPVAKRTKVGAIPGAKFFGKFGRVFGRIPIIGGLIDFAVSLMFGEKIGRAAARAVGSMLGAALGTFIPVPGVGTIIGGILGDIVGGALYDTLESFNKPKRMASGGQVGRKTTNVSRKIRAKRVQKPSKQIAQRTSPGKHVGGKEEISKLFPDSDDSNTMSSLRVLSKNSSIMKSGGVLGKFLSSGVELMALGQKIERQTLIGLEKYLAYVIDASIAEKSNVNSKALAGTMLAMAEGGIVPENRTLISSRDTTGTVVAKDIVKSFNSMMSNKSAAILQNIKSEISLFKPGVTPGAIEPTFSGEIGGYGSSEEQALLKAIRFAEGTTSSYGVIFGGAIIPELAEGKMTVKDVIDMGNSGKLPSKFGGRNAGYGSGSAATGAYQFMPYTLESLIKDGTLNLGDLFTPELQDKAALALAKRRGVTSEMLRKEGLSANISAKLAPEWASFPTLSGGSYYGQPFKELSSLQKIYKDTLSKSSISTSGSNPISVGLDLLKQGFTVAENRFFTKFQGFNPAGTSIVGRHSNSADHAEHSLDVTDWRGSESEGIERLKKLFKKLYHNKEKMGIVELIFDPIGHWFDGMRSYSADPIGGHHNHLHIRFKTPASKSIFSQQLKSSVSYNKNINLASNQPTSLVTNYISNKNTYTDNSQQTQILIQPILT
jgi:muramidase (phage lysozyme)